ncbi:MAG TPA: hypothetical protein VES88_12485 [Gemmatimonadaceae bacterium]|nr:hypothetical protein [Gemmatimonadaceae bacterium]
MSNRAEPNSVKRALAIAEQVVMTQGSIFIRELLRNKKREGSKVAIGTTKEEILDNLVKAIRDNVVTAADLDDWVEEIEGWGRQHVYMHRVGQRIVASPALESPAQLLSALRDSKMAATWGKRTSLDFPDELAISRIDFDGDVLQVGWQQRYDRWQREKSLDPPRQTIEGDVYEFRAYRQELLRSVMRFVLFVKSRRAALFIQLPLADPRHQAARDLAKATLGKLISWDELKPLSISKAIKAIDEIDLRAPTSGNALAGRMQAQNTRFGAGGATVEFDADPAIVAWKNIAAVRQVRNALQLNSFTGHSGKFIVELRSGTGLNRSVIVSLDGRQKRLYLWSQMSATEVWLVLDEVVKHG